MPAASIPSGLPRPVPQRPLMSTARASTLALYPGHRRHQRAGEPFSTGWACRARVRRGIPEGNASRPRRSDFEHRGFALVANVGPFAGEFDVVEGYVETIVPLARDAPRSPTRSISTAPLPRRLRTVGGQTNWKVGGVYEPFEGLRLRATRSRDIRAPAIWERGGPGSIIVNLITVRGVSACIPQNVTVGNPNLLPERGDTFTAAWCSSRRASLVSAPRSTTSASSSATPSPA